MKNFDRTSFVSLLTSNIIFIHIKQRMYKEYTCIYTYKGIFTNIITDTIKNNNKTHKNQSFILFNHIQ